VLASGKVFHWADRVGCAAVAATLAAKIVLEPGRELENARTTIGFQAHVDVTGDSGIHGRAVHVGHALEFGYDGSGQPDPHLACGLELLGGTDALTFNPLAVRGLGHHATFRFWASAKMAASSLRISRSPISPGKYSETPSP